MKLCFRLWREVSPEDELSLPRNSCALETGRYLTRLPVQQIERALTRSVRANITLH